MGDDQNEQGTEGGMPPLICDRRFLAAQRQPWASEYFMVVHDGRRVFPGTNPECREYVARHSEASAEEALAGGSGQLAPLPPAEEADDPA